MPELPEVETIKLQLERVLVGSAKQNTKVVSEVKVLDQKSFHGTEEQKRGLIGMEVVGVRRFGKVLVVDLEKLKVKSEKVKTKSKKLKLKKQSLKLRNFETAKLSLVIHLKMTGQLIYEKHESGIRNQGENWDEHLHDHRVVGGHPTGDFVGRLPSKYTRIVFFLTERKEGGVMSKSVKRGVSGALTPFDSSASGRTRSGKNSALFFNDQRKFGWVKLVLTEEVENLDFIKNLGMEPSEMGEEEWFSVLKSSRKAVKVRLMDQDRIAGVGNIYANDGCWEAEIDPRRLSNSLNESETLQLLKAVRKVLKEAVYYGGATAVDGKYIDLQGIGGKYQEHFRVYQREGEKCLRKGCRGVIKKTVLGGRGTYWCGKCQK